MKWKVIVNRYPIFLLNLALVYFTSLSQGYFAKII